ncbi:DUF3786 domain-containing protein [Moorella naiadis]|uniref:DUF3786 domain-containing protein n=1 Tax=Moorella naiadis (nom. illeg.) TaxID=3093670 RepID=UPI003D9CA506
MALPYNLSVTLDRARAGLDQANPEAIAELKKVTWEPEKGRFSLPSLNDVYYITYPAGKVSTLPGEPVDPRFQVLILHYLLGPGSSLRGQWISFKELPGGLIYQQPFYGRAVLPLIRTFGLRPANLLPAGAALGGKQVDQGDAAIEVNPFPQLPVRLVIWAGDEEFPPGGTILFDASAPDMLATEDFAVLAEYLVKRLKDLVRE